MQTFNIPERKFLSYLMTLEAYYLDIPYHNSIHAAEVLYNAHILLSARTLRVSGGQECESTRIENRSDQARGMQ